MGDELLQKGRAVLASQPFSVLMGAQLTVLERGNAVLILPIRQELAQQYGFAHGGVVSYLADNALTFAGGTVLEGTALTAEMKINYLRPALGEALIARAEVVYGGHTLAVVRCDIFALNAGEEKICAAAQGTITVARPR